MRKIMFSLVLVASAVFNPAAAMVTENQVYDVYFRGIKGGTLSVATKVDGTRYQAQGKVQSRGLAQLFSPFAFSGNAVGRTSSDGALVPASYAGTSVDGKKKRVVKMRYSGDRLSRLSYTPEPRKRSWSISPSDQRGTRDPISATAEILQRAPAGEACGRTIEVFDGSKRSRLKLSKRKKSGNLWRCDGVYSRVAGFRPKDMREKKNFKFAVYYRETKDGMMRAEKFESETLFGMVRAIRR